MTSLLPALSTLPRFAARKPNLPPRPESPSSQPSTPEKAPSRPLAQPALISLEQLEQDVLKASYQQPILVSFMEANSTVCTMYKYVTQQVAQNNAPWVKSVQIDVQGPSPMLDRLKLRAVPTLMLFRDGQEVARKEGSRSPAQLQLWLNEQLPDRPASQA